LRAGQHLTAKLASGELHIDEARVGGDGRAGAGASASVGDNGAVRPAATQGSAAEAVENGAANQAPPAAVPAPPPLPPSPLVPVQPSAQPTLNDPAPAAPAPETAAAAPARSPAMMHRAAPRARPVEWTPRAWSGAITTGNAARVLSQADAHGLDKTLLEVDGPALVALADASRYTGRAELAVRALLAQRQRFPDTPAAHAAAFLLGRLADDRGEVAAGLASYRR